LALGTHVILRRSKHIQLTTPGMVHVTLFKGLVDALDRDARYVLSLSYVKSCNEEGYSDDVDSQLLEATVERQRVERPRWVFGQNLVCTI
jgi:hypothetical protein